MNIFECQKIGRRSR